MDVYYTDRALKLRYRARQAKELVKPHEHCQNLKAYSLMLNRGRSQNFQILIFLHIFVALL